MCHRFAITLTGRSSMSLPADFTRVRLPVGLRIVEPLGREDLVVLAAGTLSEPRPELAERLPIAPRLS